SGRALKLLAAAGVVAVLAAPKLDIERWANAFSAAREPAGAGPADAAEPGRALRVGALVVGPAPLAAVVRTPGTLPAAEAVELRPEPGGRIASIHFEEGRAVRASDLLVKLHDADLRARLLAATGELELARRRERRAAELVAQNFVRRVEHDTAAS